MSNGFLGAGVPQYSQSPLRGFDKIFQGSSKRKDQKLRKQEVVMKKVISFIIAGMVLVFQAGGAGAVSVQFPTSAILPPATGTIITVKKVVQGGTQQAPTYTFSDWTHGTDLGFSTDLPMRFTGDPYNIWLPQYYFALNVTGVNGAGNPSVQFSYADSGVLPNGAAGHNLGYKGSATFVKVTGVPLTPSYNEATIVSATRFGAMSSVPTITPAQLAGGYLRIYVGIATGTETGANAPEVFTNADAAGTYSGTFTVTTTI